MNLTGEQRKKCKAIIHAASVAAGGVGAGLAQVPLADNALITPIQITMITSLGNVFGIHVVEGVAKGIIASSAASIAGRGVVQAIVGWVPGIGNAINTATAAGITEAIGWAAVKYFSESKKNVAKSDIESIDTRWQECLLTCTIEEQEINLENNIVNDDILTSVDMGDKEVDKRYLLGKDFFGERINIDISRIFPVMVMATMSSGKSTLINALIGEDILPNKNAACTAKVYSILDDDLSTGSKLYLTDINGRVRVVENNLSEELSIANENDNVRNILLTAQIKGVQNTEKSLLLIDTPGPNNSQDNNHGLITKDVLSQINGGLILYVINAAQMGVNDDAKLMRVLREYLASHENTKVAFVINKMDAVDEEKENVGDLLKHAREYIEKHGIISPKIFATSALAAQIFQKVLYHKELTRKEKKAFYELFERELFRPHMQNKKLGAYASNNDQKENVCFEENIYTKSELMEAIDNTGIKELKAYIQEMQILSSENDALKVNVNY